MLQDKLDGNITFNKIADGDTNDDVNSEAVSVSMRDVDKYDGVRFENFLKELFKVLGYAVETTKGSGDQGVDLLLKKDGIVIAVQAKCYTGNIGNSAVQEVYAGMKYYKADKAIVVTNRNFTKSAQELTRTHCNSE